MLQVEDWLKAECAGRDRLMAYNKRLAAGQAVFERRADNHKALFTSQAPRHALSPWIASNQGTPTPDNTIPAPAPQK